MSIEGINGHLIVIALTCTKYTHDQPGMKESAYIGITYPLLFWQITGIFWEVHFGTFDLINAFLWLNGLSSTFDNIF